MADYDCLQQRPVYRHLEYRWDFLGIGFAHLALALLPSVAWGLLISLVSPTIFDISLPAILFVAIGGAAVLDAFAAVLLPSWQRSLVAALGAAPGLALLVAWQLPADVKGALPVWPAVPLGAGGLVAIGVWQYRREPDALLVAWQWRRCPRLLDGHQAPRRPCAPLPIDRGVRTVSAAPASLAAVLPYWTTLQVPLPPGEGQAPASFACLVLKDGSVAIGLRTAAIDAYSAGAGALDAHAEIWRQALASLPSSAYLQTTFRAGFSYRNLLQRYASAGAEGSHPLLRQGRQARAAALAAGGQYRRVEITHWVGQKRLLAGLAKAPSAAALQLNTQRARSACSKLWQELRPLLAALRSGNLAPELLGEAQLIEQARLAIAHAMDEPAGAAATGPYLSAPADILAAAAGSSLLAGQHGLDVQLANGTLAVDGDHLCWQPPGRCLQLSSVSRMGEHTHANMLAKLCYEQAPTEPWTLSICHEKTDQALQKERLEQRRKWLFALIGSHFLNHDAKRAYEQSEQLLADVTRDGAQIFRTSITCVTSGCTAAQAAEQGRLAAQALQGEQVVLGVQRGGQLPGWLATLPGYGYSAPRSLLLLDGNCAHLLPNSAPTCGDGDADLVFGNRQRGLMGFGVRVGRRHDASAIIVGKTGSGKTFLFSHLAKYGCLDLGGHVVLADNKGPKNSSYRPLCELLGGSYVHLEADETVSFNPFPSREAVLKGGEVEPQSVLVLEHILAMMVEDSRAPQHQDYVRSVLRATIRAVYARAKTHQRPLILDDALGALRDFRPRNENLAAVARRVAERLEFWCEDPVRRRLFNVPTTLDASNRFCVFDFFGLDRDPALGAVLICAFAGRIEQKLRDLPAALPKLFAFDEAWAMFDASPAAAALMNRLYRTARSYGAACYIMTQDSRDVRQSPAASGILANLALIYLMRHQDGHREAAELFGLTARQAELFATLRMERGAFAETMLIDGNAQQAHVLSYAPLPFDLWCDTSRAQDVTLRQAAQAASGRSLVDTIALLAKLAPQGAPTSAHAQAALLAQCCAPAAEAALPLGLAS